MSRLYISSILLGGMGLPRSTRGSSRGIARAALGGALIVGGCRCGGAREEPPPAPTPAIEVRAGSGAPAARVVPGQPCRATVEGVELIVGGPPLVAQHGAARWTAEAAPNGVTFRKDDKPVARLYARQLFDAEGLPMLRVLEDGRIADRASAIVRTAAAADGAVRVGAAGTVSGTTDVLLAALLTAPEVTPELRAILACHLLMPSGAR